MFPSQRPILASLVIGVTIVMSASMALGSPVPDRQTRTWQIDASKSTPAVIDIEFSVRSAHAEHTSGTVQPWSSLRNLAASDVARPGTTLHFSVVREAGTFVCTGTSRANGADGTFTFAPNTEFTHQLAAAGMAPPTEDQQLWLALEDVRSDVVTTLVREQGTAPTVDDLILLGTHGVDARYAAFFGSPAHGRASTYDLILLAERGVSIDSAQRLEALGYRVDAQSLMALAVHGVTLDYVGALAALHYHPAVPELVLMREHDVNIPFVKKIVALGQHPGVRELISLRERE